ncbi:MAG: hypothetical protein LBK42_00600 [Propionibacteriaceae bacterium]|jgi:SAM-dependent methyltransferase|nr:hypothetical protein [Propionibacteriaceae bacterium]
MHDESVTILARAREPGYEVVLRQRRRDGQTIDELVINGSCAMDSGSTVSETALADTVGDNPGKVLVGGLGLGYTAARLLELGAALVDIIEVSPALVAWARDDLVQPAGRLARDDRVTIQAGDVVKLLLHQPVLPGVFGPWDAIVLDIDNGPDYLIRPGNAAIYRLAGIRSALGHLTPGGRLALWSQGPSKDLWFDLLSLDPDATEQLIVVDRSNRRIDYAIYSLRRLD